MSLLVSVITNYINLFNEVDTIRTNLESWIDQTHPAIEILLADSSKPGPERDAIESVCSELGVAFISYPFNHYTSLFARNVNELVNMAKGEAILWLCPMWKLTEKTWIEKMADRLEYYGEDYIIATENDRHALRDTPESPPKDWFAAFPTIFRTPHHAYIDNPKMIFHKSIWIPLDTDFDPPEDNVAAKAANAHGLIYWGWQQIYVYGRTILLCRDMQMEHAPRLDNKMFPREQIEWSDKIIRSKGVIP